MVVLEGVAVVVVGETEWRGECGKAVDVERGERGGLRGEEGS